jgi:hypothetical protein
VFYNNEGFYILKHLKLISHMNPGIKTTNGLFCLLLFLITSVTLAQEKETEHKPKIRGAIMMANSHIPKAFEGGKHATVIPTWGFDVDYFFHPRWSQLSGCFGNGASLSCTAALVILSWTGL